MVGRFTTLLAEWGAVRPFDEARGFHGITSAGNSCCRDVSAVKTLSTRETYADVTR